MDVHIPSAFMRRTGARRCFIITEPLYRISLLYASVHIYSLFHVLSNDGGIIDSKVARLSK